MAADLDSTTVSPTTEGLQLHSTSNCLKCVSLYNQNGNATLEVNGDDYSSLHISSQSANREGGSYLLLHSVGNMRYILLRL